MSDAQPTQGPWRFDEDDLVIRAHNGNIVVDMDSGDDIEPELSANGKLIAVAPDMVALLYEQWALERCEDDACEEHGPVTRILRSAGRLP